MTTHSPLGLKETWLDRASDLRWEKRKTFGVMLTAFLLPIVLGGAYIANQL
jgi:hypothetical protein